MHFISYLIYIIMRHAIKNFIYFDYIMANLSKLSFLYDLVNFKIMCV